MPPKQKVSWSRDATSELIELYTNQPILYMVRSPDYKNKNKRQGALWQICARINERVEFSNTVSIEDVKQKIHTLRTQYYKELHKVKVGEHSGVVHVPSLWCYTELNFLRNTDADVIVIKSECNVERSTWDELESSQVCYPATKLASTPTTKPEVTPSHRTNVAQIPATASAALEQHASARNNETVDDLEAFGMSVVQELRKIKSGSKVRALKRQIFNAIIDMQETEEGDDPN